MRRCGPPLTLGSAFGIEQSSNVYHHSILRYVRVARTLMTGARRDFNSRKTRYSHNRLGLWGARNREA